MFADPVPWRALIVKAVYGQLSAELIAVDPEAVQLSPLMPGAQRIEDWPDGSCLDVTVLAPAGVLERCYVLAHALRILVPGGRLIALAPKERGGSRIAAELSGFGCMLEQVSRRHHRICQTLRPSEPPVVAEAIKKGGPQIPPELDLWSQPGIFSWDRPDPGSLSLIRHLPALAGAGADFGCGVGLLALAVLQSAGVTRLSLVDIDRRAIDAGRSNVIDPRATFAWRDLRQDGAGLRDLDFVVMNPPFHDGGREDRALGEAFIRNAAIALKPGGVCWLVANRHLPYERPLRESFAAIRQVQQAEGYKIYEARR